MRALTASLNNVESRTLIDGIVDHAYADRGFVWIDTSTGESYGYYQMGQLELLIGAQRDSLPRYITEWNTDHTTGADNRGLSGASMLCEMFYELTTHRVQNANVWPLIYMNQTENNLLRGPAAVQTVFGAMFHLMQESLIGMTPLSDSHINSNGIKLDIHGFTSGSRAVFFISNRSVEVANDVVLDLNNATYTFDTALNTTQYFITSTQLSAVNAQGVPATGNDGTAVNPVLTYSDGYVNSILSNGDLISFSGLAASGSLRVEITYITSGNDRIEGRSGNDTAFGAAGADTLLGNLGNDSLNGGEGNDILDGGVGADILNGGAGFDTVRYESSTVGLTINLAVPSQNTGDAAGDIYFDIENLTGSGFADNLSGNTMPNQISAGAGNDSIRAGNGQDTVFGGGGDDFVFGGETAADLSDHLYGGAGNDSIDAGMGNDLCVGDAGNDALLGGEGNDLIKGEVGNDVLTGSPGADDIYGGNGDDFMNGGFGPDTLRGDAGADHFFHLGVSGHGSDWIRDYRAEEGDVLVCGIRAATLNQFEVRYAEATGRGLAGHAEAFVTYLPTGQFLWALVDGADQTHINIRLGGQVFDLLA